MFDNNQTQGMTLAERRNFKAEEKSLKTRPILQKHNSQMFYS